jgi:transposase
MDDTRKRIYRQTSFKNWEKLFSRRKDLHTLTIAINNQVVGWLDIRFLEFVKVFSKWHGHAALMKLKNFPTPEKVLKAGVDNIVSK